jgi:hypothetical protein
MEILSVMHYVRKNLSIIVVILLTLLLIAMVIWVFDMRIENIEKPIKPAEIYHPTSLAAEPQHLLIIN